MRYRRGERRRGGFGGRGAGGGTSPGSGPGGYCVCPNCGHKVEHEAGKRCIDMKCPECDTTMARE
jgi:hypothetical protein